LEERTAPCSSFSATSVQLGAGDRRTVRLIARARLSEAPGALVASVRRAGPATFATLWPELLEAHHITKSELASIAWTLRKNGNLVVTNVKPGERTMNDDHIIRAKM
jgi:hypothetical protein